MKVVKAYGTGVDLFGQRLNSIFMSAVCLACNAKDTRVIAYRLTSRHDN